MLRDTQRTRLFAVGLLVAVLVLLQLQLRLALEAIHAFEARVGLALVPSAVILGVVLLWYLQARRHEERMQRSVGDTTTRERQRRDSVLEDLTRFGLALARASDMGIVRDVVQQALPQFTGGRPFWAVVRAKGKWESVAGGLEESPDLVMAEVERLADQAFSASRGAAASRKGWSGTGGSTIRSWSGRRRPASWPWSPAATGLTMTTRHGVE